MESMAIHIHEDTLRPARCRRQPGLPTLLRVGHTEEGHAPVLFPAPYDNPLWLEGKAAGDAMAIAEDWALQMLLQAPGEQIEVHVFDSGLDASLPTLERVAAAAKAQGMAQQVHFITDAASLQMHLDLWQADARQRKSHLLQTGHASWRDVLREDTGQPLRVVLLTQFDDLAECDRRWAALPALLQNGARLGYWFWLLGPARVPPVLRTDHERAQWQDWFAQRIEPHLLKFTIRSGTLQPPETWLAHPAMQIYREFGALTPDGLTAADRAQALATYLERPAAVSGGNDQQDFWSVPIGQFQGQPYWFRIGLRSGSLHALLAGTTGTGKTSFLNLLITRSCEAYSPDELQFCLFDLKQGVSFGLFEGLPHVARVHLHDGDFAPVLRLLRDLMTERDRRKSRFLAAAPAGLVPDIGAYNRLARQRGTPTMPVLAVVIDEVQKLFVEGDFTQRREAARLVEEVAREGRAYGFTLLFSSQSYQGIDLPPAAASQFRQRLAFRLASETDCRRILAQDNNAPLRLGDWQLLVNDEFGRAAANRTVRVDHLSPEAVYHRLQAVRERYVGRVPQAWALAVPEAAPPTPQAVTRLTQPAPPGPGYVPGRYTPSYPPPQPPTEVP